MKVKVFQASSSSSIESEITKWLAANPDADIKFTNASEALGKSQYGTDRSKSVYLFYEEGVRL